MSQLIGDQRAAAKAVNAMMEAVAKRRGEPQFEREVDYIHKAYIFGHYDSRGGAMLVQAPNVKVAMEDYLKECEIGFTDTGEFDPDNYAWDTAYEDLSTQGLFSVIVCDEVLPDRGELLAGYNDDGYKVARLESRMIMSQPDETQWYEIPVVVLWKGDASIDPADKAYFNDAPRIIPSQSQSFVKYEYRLVEWQPGEDAFGLWLANQ